MYKNQSVEIMIKPIRYIILMLLFLFVSEIKGQNIADTTLTEPKLDTVYLNISDAEQRLVKRNLNLLLNYYNVDIAKANYLQAKLFFNPNLYYGSTLYNVENYKWLGGMGSAYYPNTESWDETWNIQQVLTLAGRFKATWKLAQVGVEQAQYQVADILRNLKYELYTDISDLYNNQQLIKMYRYEEVQLQHLLNVTKELYKHGNAAGNDVIQLQQQLQDAVAQEISSQQSVVDDEQDLKIILCYPEKTYFTMKELPTYKGSFPTYPAIMDSAVKNRPDLLLCYASGEYAEKNLKLQRATGMPDLTVGTTYTGANAVTPGYVGWFASMDLPVFNRNQWNIVAAKEQISQQELSDSLTLSTVKNEVNTAYSTLFITHKQLGKIDPEYGKSLDEMMANAIKNYERRNIDMLALLSLIGTYNDGKTNLLNLYVQYFNAVQNINLNTGIEILK